MQMCKRRATLAMTLLLAATACGGGGDGEGATPSTTEVQRSTTSSSTTTTTEPVDPSVVPDDPEDINEEYVEAVANELYRILGEATRAQVSGKSLKELTSRFDAVYEQRVVNDFLNSAIDDEAKGFANLRKEPGNAVISVQDVRSATPMCIAADVVLDVSEVVERPVEPFDGILILRLLDKSKDPAGINPTPWVTEGVAPAAEFEGDDPCA